MKTTHWFIVVSTVLIWSISAACSVMASDDIVYSARYYNPSTDRSKNDSHFHLYRINPDGTGRRQITFGAADDDSPVWSPNGRWIVFTRYYERRNTYQVCVVWPSGTDLHIIEDPSADWDEQYCWSPDSKVIVVPGYGQGGRSPFTQDTPIIRAYSPRGTRLFAVPRWSSFQWSPDGRRAALSNDDGARIVDLQTHRGVGVACLSPIWLGDSMVAGFLSQPSDNVVNVGLFASSGKVIRILHLTWKGRREDPGMDSADPGGRDLLATKHATEPLTYVQDTGISGNRPDFDFESIDQRTGKVAEITNGQFLVLGPGNREYCTADFHDLADYDKSTNGRSVYTAALRVGNAKAHKEHTIVDGLVWVTGADWRRSGS